MPTIHSTPTAAQAQRSKPTHGGTFVKPTDGGNQNKKQISNNIFSLNFKIMKKGQSPFLIVCLFFFLLVGNSASGQESPRDIKNTDVSKPAESREVGSPRDIKNTDFSKPDAKPDPKPADSRGEREPSQRNNLDRGKDCVAGAVGSATKDLVQGKIEFSGKGAMDLARSAAAGCAAGLAVGEIKYQMSKGKTSNCELSKNIQKYAELPTY